MRRLALLLALLASPALAADRFVTVTGAGAHDGTTLGNAYSLTEANAAAAPGTRFIMSSGSYGTSINPAAGGTGYDAASRVIYVTTATGDEYGPIDTTVVVTGIQLTYPHITVRGVKSTGAINLRNYNLLLASYASRCSVVSVIATGVQINGAKDCMLYRCKIRGYVSIQSDLVSGGDGRCYSSGLPVSPFCTIAAERDTLRACSIFLGDVTSTARAFSLWGHCRNAVVDSNAFNGGFTHAPTGANGVAFWFANSTGTKWRYNTFAIENTGTAGASQYGETFYVRDSSTIEATGNTFNMPTTGPATSLLFGPSGSFAGARAAAGSVFQQNFVKGLAYMSINVSSATASNFRVENNVIANPLGVCLTLSSLGSGLFMRHNTFYTRVARAIDQASSIKLDSLLFHGNLIVSKGTTSTGTFNQTMRWADVVSTGQDSNLTFAYNGVAQGAVLPNGRGVASAVGTGDWWGATRLNDRLSLYADPGFTDTTWATLKLWPASAGSPAFAARFTAGYAGAYSSNSDNLGNAPIDTPPADVTPPAAITTLTSTARDRTTVTLSWLAPGDNGSSGTAASYDIRYRFGSTFVDGDWAGATTVLGEPAPTVAGSTQTFVVTGITPGQTITFAIKTTDLAGNQSAISNAHTDATTPDPDPPAPDLTPPAPIHDIGLLNGDLYWTSPAGDGEYSGQTVASYDFRYSSAPITDDNWDIASQMDGEPTPVPVGLTDFFLSAPIPSEPGDWYIAARSTDAAGNTSVTGSNYSYTVPPAENPDGTAPGAILNLSAIAGNTNVRLGWSAPGNDNYTGQATTYDIRYSTSTITEANWAAATQVTGETAPQTAGTLETFTVGGLSNGTQYYFAIKTGDGTNESSLSNVASATPAVQVANLSAHRRRSWR